MGLQGYVFTSAPVVAFSTPTFVKKATYYPSASSSIILAFSKGREASTTTSINIYLNDGVPAIFMENTVATYFAIVGIAGGAVHLEIA